MKKTTLAILSTLLMAPSVFGALTLQVDTSNKTWALVGSSTGTMEFVGGFGLVEWELGGIGGSGIGVSQLQNDATWSSTIGTPGPAGFSGTDTQLQVTSTVSLILANTLPSSQTITGSGNFQSYAINAPLPARVDFDAAAIADFESIIGSTLILDRGTGFGNINVVAIPEPSSALLLGLGTIGLATRRRRV